MEVYLGSIWAFGFNFAPIGYGETWAVCNGQLLNIADYPYLFNLIGTTYGGDGIANFAVPNLQGRVPIGIGLGPGPQPYVLGQVGGSATTALEVANIPAHTHQVTTATLPGAGAIATETNPQNAYYAISNQPIYQATAGNNTTMAANTAISSSYVPQPFPMPINVMTPYMVVNYCICTYGIIPTPVSPPSDSTGNGESPQTDIVAE